LRCGRPGLWRRRRSARCRPLRRGWTVGWAWRPGGCLGRSLLLAGGRDGRGGGGRPVRPGFLRLGRSLRGDCARRRSCLLGRRRLGLAHLRWSGGGRRRRGLWARPGWGFLRRGRCGSRRGIGVPAALGLGVLRCRRGLDRLIAGHRRVRRSSGGLVRFPISLRFDLWSRSLLVSRGCCRSRRAGRDGRQLLGALSCLGALRLLAGGLLGRRRGSGRRTGCGRRSGGCGLAGRGSCSLALRPVRPIPLHRFLGLGPAGSSRPSPAFRLDRRIGLGRPCPGHLGLGLRPGLGRLALALGRRQPPSLGGPLGRSRPGRSLPGRSRSGGSRPALALEPGRPLNLDGLFRRGLASSCCLALLPGPNRCPGLGRPGALLSLGLDCPAALLGRGLASLGLPLVLGLDAGGSLPGARLGLGAPPGRGLVVGWGRRLLLPLRRGRRCDPWARSRNAWLLGGSVPLGGRRRPAGDAGHAARLLRLGAGDGGLRRLRTGLARTWRWGFRSGPRLRGRPGGSGRRRLAGFLGHGPGAAGGLRLRPRRRGGRRRPPVRRLGGTALPRRPLTRGRRSRRERGRLRQLLTGDDAGYSSQEAAYLRAGLRCAFTGRDGGGRTGPRRRARGAGPCGSAPLGCGPGRALAGGLRLRGAWPGIDAARRLPGCGSTGSGLRLRRHPGPGLPLVPGRLPLHLRRTRRSRPGARHGPPWRRGRPRSRSAHWPGGGSVGGPPARRQRDDRPRAWPAPGAPSAVGVPGRDVGAARCPSRRRRRGPGGGSGARLRPRAGRCPAAPRGLGRLAGRCERRSWPAALPPALGAGTAGPPHCGTRGPLAAPGGCTRACLPVGSPRPRRCCRPLGLPAGAGRFPLWPGRPGRVRSIGSGRSVWSAGRPARWDGTGPVHGARPPGSVRARCPGPWGRGRGARPRPGGGGAPSPAGGRRPVAASRARGGARLARSVAPIPGRGALTRPSAGAGQALVSGPGVHRTTTGRSPLVPSDSGGPGAHRTRRRAVCTPLVPGGPGRALPRSERLPAGRTRLGPGRLGRCVGGLGTVVGGRAGVGHPPPRLAGLGTVGGALGRRRRRRGRSRLREGAPTPGLPAGRRGGAADDLPQLQHGERAAHQLHPRVAGQLLLVVPLSEEHHHATVVPAAQLLDLGAAVVDRRVDHHRVHARVGELAPVGRGRQHADLVRLAEQGAQGDRQGGVARDQEYVAWHRGFAPTRRMLPRYA
jgi:hypothetical protein